jgi:hypothetical protein
MKKGLTRTVSLAEMKAGKRVGVQKLSKMAARAKKVQEDNARFNARLEAERAGPSLGVIRD